MQAIFEVLNTLSAACKHIMKALYHIKLNIEKLEENNEICNHNVHQELNLHVQFRMTNILKKKCNEYRNLLNKLPNKIMKLEKCGNLKGK